METRPAVAHCATPFLGPTMVWLYDQIRSLTRYRPVVLTQAVRNREAFPFHPVYSMEDLPRWRQTLYRAVRKMRGTYAGYAPILKQEQADVIHAHFGQEGYRCLEARRDARVPMVTTFYGVDVSALPKQKTWRRRFERLFAEGERFLAEGTHMAERLAALGCPPAKIRIQRLGVDLSRIPFSPSEPQGMEQPVVLMYATFREKKGHVYGLRAFRQILDAHPRLRMRIVGDGPLRAEIEREIQRLGLEDRVVLLGMKPHGESLQELKKATLLLYPSVTASDEDTEGGAPVALIEAMATGVPVVSSHHADIPEIVIDGQCGILAEERDVGRLAEGLDALLKSPELHAKIGRAGRAHVEANHNLQVQGRRLEEIYDRTIGG